MKEVFLTFCTALVLHFYHQPTVTEVGMGNCNYKTEFAHAKLNQLSWLLALMDGEPVSLLQTIQENVTHTFLFFLK